MDKTRIYLSRGDGRWYSSREGLHSTKPRGHWVSDGVSSFYAVTSRKLLSSVGLGAELVGLECGWNVDVHNQVSLG